MSNKPKCPTSLVQSVPLLGSLYGMGHFWDTNLSGNGFSMSCDVLGEGMKNPLKHRFKGFVLIVSCCVSGL
jgi:hypothetical protein